MKKEKNKNLLIVGAVHGNEKVGVEVVKRLNGLVGKKQVLGLTANNKAFSQNVRFIDQDLNRSFPGNPKGNYEEQRAFQLVRLIKKFNYVLDLHSFSCKSKPFVIVTKRTAQHLVFAKAVGIKRIVFMSPELASGKALIDHCQCGVSVEAGRHGSKITDRRAENVIENVLSELGFLNARKKKEFKRSYFQVVQILFKNSRKEKLLKNIQNFVLVQKGDTVTAGSKQAFVAPYRFYPILARERAYSKILCLMAKPVRIRKEETRLLPPIGEDSAR